ncbi:MAG: beta-eliminating lyase-related protein, partial [Defluviitaleaceae bacterium]|nr:beta-eliminating lyase-related protein [Defluviitaleaceae bacterium]
RKLLGGGMRQIGVLAACGIISLQEMTQRLHTDHENARYLAEKLAAVPRISVDVDTVQINMVFFKVTAPGFDEDAFMAYLQDRGIKINGTEQGLYRFVTHHDISRGDIDVVIDAIKDRVGA